VTAARPAIGLALRRGAGLNHRAGVGVAVRDTAGKRRRDPRVGEQRLGLVIWLACDTASLLFGRGDCGFGGGDLRLGDAIAPERLVDVLLGDEIGRCFMTAARRLDPRWATSCAGLGTPEIRCAPIHFLAAAA